MIKYDIKNCIIILICDYILCQAIVNSKCLWFNIICEY